MNEWLDRARRGLAEAVGDEVSAYELDTAAVDRILELARVAAHESGARTNAPLLAYLVGVAHGRHPESSLEELADATRS